MKSIGVEDDTYFMLDAMKSKMQRKQNRLITWNEFLELVAELAEAKGFGEGAMPRR